MISKDDVKIAIIGLGYVGLPLAAEFGKIRQVVGFDVNHKRILELKEGIDVNLETTEEELRDARHLTFTSSIDEIRECNFYIITVPTPINDYKQPDLTPLIMASETVGKVLRPGISWCMNLRYIQWCTEEECVPILERMSAMTFNKDFFVGYSPERINPGDKKYRLTTIKKITSGSTAETACLVDEIHRQIITAGTYKTESIKIAEAAKVIENTQRDLNIALVNELAIIFNRLEIDTEAVLRAAGSKWNFLPFRPRLVGGHCIGVDPYYLTHKSQGIGYYPEIILAGRRLNDNMGNYVSGQLIKAMIKKGINVEGSNVLILGFTFKENCPDIRNTRIIDVVKELGNYSCNVDIFDPWVDAEEVEEEYGIIPVSEIKAASYDAIIVAVGHEQFKKMGSTDIRGFGKDKHVLYDLKYILSPEQSDVRL